MEKGVQHNPTTQLTRIPAASARNNQVEAGRRTNIASGTGLWGRSFLLTGLWHGAAWNFVLWGAYHGLLILGDRSLRRRIPLSGITARLVGTFVTFGLIHFGWLLFRSGNLDIIWDSVSAQLNGNAVGDATSTAYMFFLILVFSLPLWAHIMFQSVRSSKWMNRFPLQLGSAPVMTGISTALFVGILLMKSEISSDFIYFEF